MKKKFIDHKFSKASLVIIGQANKILEEYSKQGLVLSLRQIYYQFVARDMLPNKQSEYKKLGDIISNARLAGLIDWDQMEDRTRFTRGVTCWDSPKEILATATASYREDVWRTQRYRPEVWIEKDALVGVIESVCREYRVKYFACRGYSSQSAQYEAGERFAEYLAKGQTPLILHLGDHDPSGIDMTRDNMQRVSCFAGQEIEVKRLALNMNQVEEHNPPPNPAKETDTRAKDYIEKYGESSWELDALEPSLISDLVKDALDDLIDSDAWNDAIEEEDQQRNMMEGVSAHWPEIQAMLKKKGVSK